MDENLSKMFKQAYIHTESRLSDDVWRVIQAKQAKDSKIQSLIYSFMGILSFGSFIFIILSLKNQLSSSGFFHYASLVFSDGSLLTLYWREYLLSLADSLPIASLGASVFLLFSILISIKKVIGQYKSQLLTI